jgi:hypothetical protein
MKHTALFETQQFTGNLHNEENPNKAVYGEQQGASFLAALST